mgnify:FL=1|jgi:hypothetical protein
MITHMSIVYFFLGFLSALIVVELTDGKPATKANLSNIEYEIHIEQPWPIQDTPQQDTFNSQRKN